MAQAPFEAEVIVEKTDVLNVGKHRKVTKKKGERVWVEYFVPHGSSIVTTLDEKGEPFRGAVNSDDIAKV